MISSVVDRRETWTQYQATKPPIALAKVNEGTLYMPTPVRKNGSSRERSHTNRYSDSTRDPWAPFLANGGSSNDCSKPE